MAKIPEWVDPRTLRWVVDQAQEAQLRELRVWNSDGRMVRRTAIDQLISKLRGTATRAEKGAQHATLSG